MKNAADFMVDFHPPEARKAVQLGPVFEALMPWLQQADAGEVKALAQAMLALPTPWTTALSDVLAWLDEADWPGLVAQAVRSLQVSDAAHAGCSPAVRTVLECAGYQQRAALQAHLEALSAHEFDWPEPTHPVQPVADAMHLIFPQFYLKPGISWIPRSWHPSWNLPSGGPSWPVGGEGKGQCKSCGGQLQHLISLPAAVVYGLGDVMDEAMDGAMLHLQLCLSCMESGLGELHYHHDAQCQAHCLNASTSADGEWIEPDVQCGPLRAGTATLAQTPARWQRQDWGMSNGRENLYRVGGAPSWVQSPWYPVCRGCGQSMDFVLQLDSQVPQQGDGQPHYWGRGAMLYAFACQTCAHSAFITQHT